MNRKAETSGTHEGVRSAKVRRCGWREKMHADASIGSELRTQYARTGLDDESVAVATTVERAVQVRGEEDEQEREGGGRNIAWST